ncbi:unnamed protein product [Calypogeia fissa]
MVIVAGNSDTVTGQNSDGASVNIVYGDQAATNPNDIQVKVFCFHFNGSDTASATLIPGQNLFFTFPPSEADLWYCQFESQLQAPTPKTFQQSFEVWKHDQVVSNFLNQCLDCKWKVQFDGFYWFSDETNAWILEYPWLQTA